MTLRFRLTLWYTILLALMLLTFAFVFHAVLARALSNQVDDTIRSQAEQIVKIFEKNIDPTAAQMPTAIVLSSQVFAQATTAAGELINSSPNLGDMRLPWPDTTKQRNLQGESALYTWQDSENTLRIYSAPVRSPTGDIAAVVQVAQSLTPIQQMLETVRLALLAGSGIALVLAAVGGAAISGTALRPLNQIAETTSRIALAEDLNQRIEGAYPNDEVGQLAETFNDMMERLQDLFETQRQLVADVSHELRTPLATIQGNIDLLRRGVARDPHMLQESLEAIDAEVARMSRLVRDLLLLAEAEGGLTLHMKPVEVDTVLLEVYREAQLMANGRQKVRLGHEDQALVQGDADRLKQLLLNLVSNAIAYTPEGGTVTLSLNLRPDGWVRVCVADTGIGIASEDLPHIFDRFWRVDRARTRKAGGSGLGLSIARSIAEAHGGTLEVESELGKGSTFEVLLPQLNGAGGLPKERTFLP